MIISASYRTDIPACFGEWFLHRLRAGYCRTVNPYGGQVYRIDLRPATVDGFVFWTKNIAPFLIALDEVRDRGFPFIVQHGLTGYPRVLEPASPPVDRAVECLQHIAAAFGPRAVVWRYDPIIFTSLTPFDWHVNSFADLSRRLAGISDEVVVSFAHPYRKTIRKMDAAASAHGFTWHDPPPEEKRRLATRFAEIAAAARIRLSVCSQMIYEVSGAVQARCVDAQRLSEIAGRPIAAKRLANRPDCGCDQSRDIGAYDTCPSACAYCYAVNSPQCVVRRFRAHDPQGEFLFPPAGPGAHE